MQTQISTTIELNPELANLAYEMRLNVSKICENALKGIEVAFKHDLKKSLVDENLKDTNS